MTNKEIAGMLEEIADLLEIKGEKPFRLQAYRRAARSLEFSPAFAEALYREGRLEEIPNVGESLAAKIGEALSTGQIGALEELRKEFPQASHELLALPGVGPQMAGRLVRELGVKTLEELETALHSGRLEGLPGMGKKTAQNLLAAIERVRSRPDRIPLVDALEIVAQVEAALSGCGDLRRFTPVGSIRRQEATIGDLDLIAVSDDPEEVMNCFVGIPTVKEILAHGPSKSSVALENGRQVDLRIVGEASYGSMLQHFTGSKEHNIQLREYALKRGVSINDFGMEDLKTGEFTPCAAEEDVYRRLAMEIMAPEMRQGTGEIEASLEHRLPRLVTVEDLKGDLHAHTTYSDGANSIREMALAAKALGYEYLAITDHSQSRGNAGGLSVERLQEQAEEVRRVNGEIDGITLLHGTEVDIRSDGTLDFPDEVLMGLDFVVASIHSALRQDRQTITERLIRAARHPAVNVIGHPTGRLLGKRDGSDVDLESLYVVCAEHRTALEVSGVPHRLDLEGTLARRAKEKGVMLALDTDSHRTTHLQRFRSFAVGQARRGWLEPEDALNTRSLADLVKYLQQKRPRSIQLL